MIKWLFPMYGRCENMYKGIYYLLLLLFIVGCSFDSSQNTPDEIETVGRLNEVVATNLDIPWNIAKNQGHFYISQRDGKIIEIDSTSGTMKVQSLSVTKEVQHVGEGGLLGFVLTSDFDTSQQAFAYYTYQQNGIKNRVVALKKEGDIWVETNTLLEDIPGGNIHNGGRIQIGPDGLLYVTAGDAGTPDLAQDKTSLAGKILRMNLDGTIPKDNPFQNSYVFSFGHRNPQGLAWDEKGQLYSTEHGQIAHDEINLIEPGQNYGWPIIQGDEEEPGMMKPLYHTGDITWAPSGIEYHNGKLYIATLRDARIRSFDLSSKSVEIIHENSGRMRDVYIEGSSLYTITSNRDGRGNPTADDDKLIRIELVP